MRHPEHVLQTQIKAFVRESIEAPHSFQCFDRAANHSGRQHLWEKNRGIRAGQPDTLLLCDGRAIYCELKAPGNKPSDAQLEMGREIEWAGGVWFWADSVVAYYLGMVAWRIPMRANAGLIADHREALFQSYLLKGSVPKTRKASKPRVAKPSLSHVRRTEALRKRIAF
jgi:hypothetical protein